MCKPVPLHTRNCESGRHFFQTHWRGLERHPGFCTPGRTHRGRRGIGPLRRSGPFLIHLAYNLPGAAKPWHPAGPIGPRSAIIIGAWWLFQEIVLSALNVGDVSVAGDQIALTLPASKTDTEAIGVERAHTCTCGTLKGGCRHHQRRSLRFLHSPAPEGHRYFPSLFN